MYFIHIYNELSISLLSGLAVQNGIVVENSSIIHMTRESTFKDSSGLSILPYLPVVFHQIHPIHNSNNGSCSLRHLSNALPMLKAK